jgi:D-ribose pyranose/furanose isomerase RbsD
MAKKTDDTPVPTPTATDARLVAIEARLGRIEQQLIALAQSVPATPVPTSATTVDAELAKGVRRVEAMLMKLLHHEGV